MATFQIRPGTPADLPALVAIYTADMPDSPATLEMQEFRDRNRKPELPFGRLVAEQEGAVAGVANYFQPEWSGEVGKLWISVTVHPDSRGQGVGRALYDAVLAAALLHQPTKLSCILREDRPDALHFAASRSYVEIAREQDVELDLAQLNTEQREHALTTAHTAGYELTPFAAIIQRLGTDEAWRRLHALDTDASRDVPLPPGDSMAFPTLDRYRESFENNPEFDASLWYVAARADELTAVSQLWRTPVAERMTTGFTGVARAHRGHRLAWALKYLALEEAIRRGASTVRTTNDALNLPMRNINTGLGFLPIPAYLIMRRTLDS